MLLSVAVIAVALIVIGARFGSRDDGGVARVVIWIAALLPAVALAVTAFLGRGSDRERIDVQFTGYRFPISRIQKCGLLGKNITRGGGVWIGGGRRWTDDLSPDVIALPGYRGHLAELCSDNGVLQLRQVRPGETWFQLPSQKWDLQRTNDVDTQRLVIRAAPHGVDRGCVTYATHSVKVASIVDFATRERKHARRTAPSRGWRDALRKRFGGWPEDGEVACVDIASGTPTRCADSLLATAAPVLVWPSKRNIAGGWDLLPPDGASWNDCSGGNAIRLDQAITIKPPQVSVRSPFAQWKKQAAHVKLRMVTRRTVGGVADQNVPIATASFEPLPLRLGTEYDLAFARAGNDLVVLFEDPSAQLRMTDLYGGPALEVKEGEFDVTFSSPAGEELLVADLSSRADHFAPKTIFEGVQARVTIPQKGEDFSIIGQGRPAEKRTFNEVFALDVSPRQGAVRPLLLFRRAGVPAMTLVLPLLAAFLVIGATFLDSDVDSPLPLPWLITPLLLALLDFRFALSTRWLVNEFSTTEALRAWILNGAYLLIAPPVVLMTASLLRRGNTAIQMSRSTDDLYAMPSSASAAGQSGSRSWRVRGIEASRALRARLGEREVVPLLQWLVIAAPMTIIWVVWAGGEPADVIAVMLKLIAVVGVSGIAAAAARLVYRAARRFAEWDRDTEDPFGFGDTRRSKWRRLVAPMFVRALILTAVYVGVRLVTYLFGSQEQVLGMRVDVLSLPLAAALLAAFTHPQARGRAAVGRFFAFLVLFAVLFVVVGGAMNDFGLLWIGGMAFVLALPAAMDGRVWAYVTSIALFLVIFISPIVAPRPFRELMRIVWGNRQEIGTKPNTARFTDDLQVSRDRDYYRLIDANQPQWVTAIPSQLAREVVIERERVHYQSLDGAWREPFRSDNAPHSPWTGAGFLRGRAVVGDSTFTRAARTDYVFPTYVRAEFGTLGLLAALMLYVAMFVFGVLGTLDRTHANAVALWSMAIAAGTGLFMLGATSGIFAFSGKWPLLFSFASNSDIALGLTLLTLGIVERE